MSERNLQYNPEFEHKTKEQLAEEHARSVVGLEPAETDFNDRDRYENAYREYWDRYYDVYYDYLDGIVDNYLPSEDEMDDEDFDDIYENTPNNDPYFYNPDQNMLNEAEDFLKVMRELIAALEGRPSSSVQTESATFFRFPEARKEVYEFSKAIAEYLHNNKIKDLVIVDRSSRPLYIGVMEYWKNKFKDEQHPGIYFLNPKGFKNRELLSAKELQDADEDASYKGDPSEDLSKVKSEADIIAEFKKAYPKLLADKDQPVLIFDTCIHSGDTLASVVDTFEKIGFVDARVGSVNPSDSGSKVHTDFYITNQRPEQGCYPFDRDRMIEKTFEHVYSKPSHDRQKRAMGVALRQEIKKIMQENLGR